MTKGIMDDEHPIYADLHIHSPYSIAVSQTMDLKSLVQTARWKGLDLLATGDITHPAWRKSLREGLTFEHGVYRFQDRSFILQTEIEDSDSIHHLILLPDFRAAEILQEKLALKTKNITGRWAGRPHVHLNPAEIVDLVTDIGGILGPAHAFTPYKSIFRSNRYRNLHEAYKGAEKNLAFIELGLSANSDLADRLSCLHHLSFLSNSDAHSEHPISLGRECNRFEIDAPSFDEIRMACLRQNGRKITANLGLDPRLGKYYSPFCSQCRRRVQIIPDSEEVPLFWDESMDVLKIMVQDKNTELEFIDWIERGNIFCPACRVQKIKSKKADKKMNNSDKEQKKAAKKQIQGKIQLGVADRVQKIQDLPFGHHPSFRPIYYNSVPLLEIIRVSMKLKTIGGKRINKLYRYIVENFKSEYQVLIDRDNIEIGKYIPDSIRSRFLDILTCFKESKIQYMPGGGGMYGEIAFDV